MSIAATVVRRLASSLLALFALLGVGCASLQSERLPRDAFLAAVELTDVPFFPH